MAIVTNPLTSGEARGSVGGTVHCTGSTRHMVRSRIKPVTNRSNYSTRHRASVYSASTFGYSNLPPAGIDLWVDFASKHVSKNKLGQTISLSPGVWFKKFNMISIKYFDNETTTPPLKLSVDYYPDFDFSRTVDGIELSWSEPIPSDSAIVVFTWRNLLAAQDRWRQKKFGYTFDVTFLSPQVVCPHTGAGSGPEGLPATVPNLLSYFWVMVVNRDGRSSPFLFEKVLNI